MKIPEFRETQPPRSTESVLVMDWNAIALQAALRVTLIEYPDAAENDHWPPEPPRTLYSTGAIPLTVLAEQGEFSLFESELRPHLTDIGMWGFSLELLELPYALHVQAGDLSGHWYGPFSSGQAPRVGHRILAETRTRWIHLQEAMVNHWALTSTMGSLHNTLKFEYQQMLLRKDVQTGVLLEGQPVAVTEALLRDWHLSLARAALRRGDRAGAAQQSLLALYTLPLSMQMSASDELSRTFVSSTRELPSGQVIPNSAGARTESTSWLKAILDEFGDLSGDWRLLDTYRNNQVVRLSVLADEGLVTWREAYSARMLERGALVPLFGSPDDSTERDVRTPYQSYSQTNYYRRGLELFDAVEARVGGPFLVGSELVRMMLHKPLEDLARCVPIATLREIPADSGWSANTRLERLASTDIPRPEMDPLRFVRRVHELLDADLPGLYTEARRHLISVVSPASPSVDEGGTHNVPESVNVSLPCDAEAVATVSVETDDSTYTVVVTPSVNGLRYRPSTVRITANEEFSYLPEVVYGQRHRSRVDERDLTMSVTRSLHLGRISYLFERGYLTVRFIIDQGPPPGPVNIAIARRATRLPAKEEQEHEQVKVTYNVSWPCAEGEIDQISWSIVDDRFDLLVRPGPDGMSFSSRTVKFTRGDDYLALEGPAPSKSPRRRSLDSVQLSIPYVQGSIENVRYVHHEGYVTFVFTAGDAGLLFGRRHVKIARVPSAIADGQ